MASDRPGAHIPALDGVRAVAVLLVVLHHAFLATRMRHPADAVLDAIAASAWVGVDLFFVLSGFLITGILLDARDAPRFFRAFYWRRLVRIFPLYYAYLLVAFGLWPVLFGRAAFPAAAAEQVWFWTYLANVPLAREWLARGVNHFWSLAIEEQFYLVWPAVVWALGRQRLGWLLVALLPAVAALRGWLLATGTSEQAVYVGTLTRFDALAFGAGVAVLARSAGGLARWREASAAVGVGGAALLGVWAATRAGLHFKPLSPAEGAALYTAIAATFASGLLWLVASPGSRAARWLSGRALREVGKVSYAMYVFQVPVDVALRRAGAHPGRLLADDALHAPWMLAYAALVALLSFLAAQASWHLLEARFLRLKDRVAYR